MNNSLNPVVSKKSLSNLQSFREGLLTNALNPKCTLFMLSVFTLVIHPGTPYVTQVALAAEIVLIAITWFILLSFMLAHRAVKSKIDRVQHIVTRSMGVFLILFGLRVAFVDVK